MFTIKRHIELDAGHRVPAHDGACRFLHGHRYRVTACLIGHSLAEEGSAQGMVMDFGQLKQCMMQSIHAPYDHRLILWARDPLLDDRVLTVLLHEQGLRDGLILVEQVPTAENLARAWYMCLNHALPELMRWLLYSVEVHETPNSVAVFATHTIPDHLARLAQRLLVNKRRSAQ